MNTIAYFEIQSSDPLREIAFYTTVFGWAFTRDPHIPIEYHRIATKGMQGGLMKRPAQNPLMESGTNAFTCSVMVEDFDAIAAKILAHGGRVAMPKFGVPGRCWQGYFRDPDNNVFGVFEPDQNAG
jgi:predicted enzyme related to lactoylglutathione lyase